MTCLDYKGHSTLWSDSYLTNEGPQMKALKGMLDRLVEPRDPSKWDYMAPNDNIYNPSFLENFFWIPYRLVKDSWEFMDSLFAFIFMEIFFYGP